MNRVENHRIQFDALMANARAHATDIEVSMRVTAIAMHYRALYRSEVRSHVGTELLLASLCLFSAAWLTTASWWHRAAFGASVLVVAGCSVARLWRSRHA